MDPLFQSEVSDNTSSNKTQIIVTFGLGAVLVGIIAGYIYFGMSQAKVSNSIVPLEQGISDVDTEENMRQITLDALRVAPAEQTGEDRQAIIDALGGTPAEQTGEDRQAIIEALKASSDVDN